MQCSVQLLDDIICYKEAKLQLLYLMNSRMCALIYMTFLRQRSSKHRTTQCKDELHYLPERKQQISRYILGRPSKTRPLSSAKQSIESSSLREFSDFDFWNPISSSLQHFLLDRSSLNRPCFLIHRVRKCHTYQLIHMCGHKRYVHGVG